MDTMEKYVCGYIVECLTGIQGSTPERMHEVLMATEARIDNPVLAGVLELAKCGPERKEVKDAVVALVLGFAVVNKRSLVDAIVENFNNMSRECKPVEPVKTQYILSFSRQGDEALFIVWKDLLPARIFNLPTDRIDTVKEKFLKHFPDGDIVDADK